MPGPKPGALPLGDTLLDLYFDVPKYYTLVEVIAQVAYSLHFLCFYAF